MNDAELRAARMRSQRIDCRMSDPVDLLRHLAGVQAQEPNAAALSIRARTTGVTAADVERAIAEERSVVRMWTVRGTLHLIAAEDARWMHDLLAPLSMPAQQRRLDELGVPPADRARAVETIRAVLDDGPLTRTELCEHLERAGIDTSGQKAAHLPRLAALEGHVCFGPRRGGKDTYALVEDWIGAGAWRRTLDRDAALDELARRYTGAYGPAEPRDMAAWSGLALRDVRAAWERIAPEPPAARKPPSPPVVRLLPAFDTYLLGYATRELAVPEQHARTVWPGGGIVRPTVVVGGLVAGVWTLKRGTVAVERFGRGPAERRVDAEVRDIRRFLGADEQPRPGRASTSRECGSR